MADFNDFAREQGPEALRDAIDGAQEPPPEDRLWPEPLDLRELAQREPEQPKFIVSNWLPAGYATLLAGHGGAGKSYIALHLAVCIASGAPWCGITVERRRVLIMTCEDRTNLLHWRLSRICAHLGLDMADLAGWLTIHELVGRDTILWHHDPQARTPLTPAYDELSARMTQAGADVLMVDGIADVYAGSENDRAQVKAFVNALLSLVSAETGAALLIGHVNKPTASAGTSSEGYSGSTQWHNAVRARWYLCPEMRQDEDEDRPQKTGELTLELQKSNLGRTDQQISFRWDDDAHLFVGYQPEGGIMASIREQSERNAIMEAMAACRDRGDYVPAAMMGSRTAYSVLRATGKLPDTLPDTRAGRKRFGRRLEDLRAKGKVREGSITRKDRHTVRTLELVSETDSEVRACGQ